MDEQTPKSGRPIRSLLRALLIGSGLTVAAVGVSLFSAAPAEAAEGPTQDGLLGGLSEVVDATTGAVEQILDAAPAGQITAPALQTIDHVVTTAPVAGPIVAVVAGPTPTTSVVAPVTGLVDATLGATSQVVGDAGGVVDDLLPVVTVPTPQPPSIPGIQPGRDGDVEVAALAPPTSSLDSSYMGSTVRSAHRTSEASASITFADVTAFTAAPSAPALPVPGLPGGGDSALPASSSGASGGLKQFFAPAGETPSSDALATPVRLHSAIPDDDDLPSSVVADTDSSPD